jgi:hypothetical protein
MKTLAPALALALLVGSASLARAQGPGGAAPPPEPAPAAPAPSGFGQSGGFVSLGVGTIVNTGGDLAPDHGTGLAYSLAVGQRLGMFGLEVGLTRYGLERDGIYTWTNTTIAAGGRFVAPLRVVVQPYLRAGIEKTWMKAGERSRDYSGTGWYAGLGGQYQLRLGPISGTVWAEVTRHQASFVNDEFKRDGAIDMLAAGIAVGF